MSSKKLVHKRKLGEQGVQFRPNFSSEVKDALKCADEGGKAKQFLSALADLQRQHLVHAQLDALPPLCKALTSALGSTREYSDAQAACIQVALLLLFQPCATHLHPPLTAALAPHIKSDACDGILNAALVRCLDACKQSWETQGSSAITHIPLAPAWAALLRAAPQRPALQHLATRTLTQLAEELQAAMEQISAGAHAAPQLSEDVQAAISAQYSTLQRFGRHISSTPCGSTAVTATADSLMLVLSDACVLREAALSAAAALWTAATLPDAAPAPLALEFVRGLMQERLGGARMELAGVSCGGTGRSFVREHWEQQGTSVEATLRGMQPIGRACAMRALAACIPVHALCAPAVLSSPAADGGAAPAPRPWHLLVDGLVEEAVAVARGASDSQLTFNSMTALTACLQRAAGIHQRPGQSEADADPKAQDSTAEGQPDGADAVPAPPLAPPCVSERCVEQVLEVVVSNMEERMKLTTHQAAEAFAAACGAAAAQAARLRSEAPADSHCGPAGTPEEAAAGLETLERAVARLVALPAKAKGRYSLLVVLVPHVGAGAVLQQRPGLVTEALHSLREETCTAATHFLKELLLQLRQEIGTAAAGGGSAATGGSAAAVAEWRRHWVGPLVDALRVEDALFRGRVVNYALPMLLDLDPESLPELLRLQRGEGKGGDGDGDFSPEAVGPTIAVLLAAHALNLFSSLDAVIEDDAGRCHVPRWVLRAAAVHRDEQLRQQTLELVALHAKTSAAAGQEELDIVKQQLILTMRTTSSPAHNKLAVVLEKLVARIRLAALGAQQRRAARERAAQSGGRQPGSAQRNTAPTHRRLIFVSPRKHNSEEEEDEAAQQRLEAFLQWLTQHTCDSLYAGAPHARRHFAVRALHIVLAEFQHDGWLARPLHGADCGADGGDAVLRAALQRRHKRDTDALRQLETAAAVRLRRFQPFAADVFGPGLVQVLLAAAVDSWAPLRTSVLAALRVLPRPLPGLEHPEAVEALSCWALRLLRSPRPFEAAAAAQVLSLLHDAYALGLGWQIRVHPTAAVRNFTADSTPHESGAAGGHGSGSKELTIEEAQRTGVIAPVGLRASVAFLASAVDAIEASVEVAERDLTAACRESFLQGPLLLLQALLSAFPWAAVMPLGHNVVQQCRGLLQRTLTGVFRAAELCAPYLDGRYNVDAADVTEGDAVAAVEDALDLDAHAEGQGESLGPEVTLLIAGSWCTVKEIAATLSTLITRVPIVVEARGTSDVASSGDTGGAGFLSNAQVRSIGEYFVESLCTLKHNGATRKLEQRFELVCKRLLQQQDAALAALPQAWLLRVLGFLQRPGQTRSDIVRRSAGVPSAVVAICQAEPNGAAKRLLPLALRSLLDTAKGPATSGEPWPLVHAYNCLRTIFESSSLAMDAAAVFSEGIETSILGMSAEEWEVRNTATLTYVVLVTRVHGFKNSSSPTAQRATTTAQGFLSTFPSLHPFLLAQLGSAVSHTEAAPQAAPHATLLPILMLLTRLQPSGGATRTAAAGTPEIPLKPFRNLITRCLHVPGFAVREHAATALAVLHTPDTLPAALRDLLGMLPETEGQLRKFSANSVHGALMAMEQLLLRAVPAAPAGQQQAAMQVLGTALPQRLWLADAARTSCPGVSRAFVHVLRSCHGSASMEGAMDVLRAALWAAKAQHSYAPMYSLWLESIMQVLLGMLEGKEAPQHAAAVAAAEAVSHPVGEVRMAALQWLEAAAGSAQWPHAVAESVGVAAHAQLRRADSAAATGAALAVLRSLVARVSTAGEPAAAGGQDAVLEQAARGRPGSAEQASAGEGSLGEPGDVSWEVVAERSREADAAVQSHSTVEVELGALQFRAAVFGQWLAATLRSHPEDLAAMMSEGSLAARCGFLCTGLHGHVLPKYDVHVATPDRGCRAAGDLLRESEALARPSELEASRLAAAATLRLSGLLRLCLPDAAEDAEKGAACPAAAPVALALRAWGLAVQLAEDEDDDVRERVAEAMGAVVQEHACRTSVAELPLFASVAETAPFASTSCAECVLRLSFQMLTACLHRSAAFRQWLIDCVAGRTGPIASAASARPARRLFDREADNHHCDGLLVSHLAARCLHHCITTSGPLPAPLRELLAATAADLLVAANTAADSVSGVDHLNPWLAETACMPVARGLLLAQAAVHNQRALSAAGDAVEPSAELQALRKAVEELGAEGPQGGTGLVHPALCTSRRAVLGMMDRLGARPHVADAAAGRDGEVRLGQQEHAPTLFLAC